MTKYQPTLNKTFNNTAIKKNFPIAITMPLSNALRL